MQEEIGEEVGAECPRQLLGDYILMVALRMLFAGDEAHGAPASTTHCRWRQRLLGRTDAKAPVPRSGQLTSTVGVKI